MTRKKSNVKALALAITCAILAGGYSGLNPVYAATPVYHDVVKYDSANRTLDYEYDAGAGTGTAAIQKINFGNIVLDGSSGSGVITATGLKLNGIGDVKTAIEGKADQAAGTDNKNNIQTLETKTKNISYNATTGTTVEGVVLKDKGISAAGGKFTVKADGQTVFTGAPDDKDKTTIKNGETVVEGANGKVTINNSGIDIAQTAQDTGESYSIKLDSGYVKASGYVQAPKFYIDNNNVFAKEADGTSRLTVSDVDETGAVTKFVRIGGGTISASGDVNVAGNLWVGKTSIFNDGINTDKIDEKTTGAGVTVEGVKFKAGAVSGVKSINNNLQFESDGIYLNKGDADKQIKLGTDGKIIIGTSSSAYDTDGFYAGGHDFDGAKAAIDAKDGKIKGAGGKFGVDDQGNVTTTGEIRGKDITAKGKLSAAGGAFTVDADGAVKAAGGKFGVDKDGNTTVGGTLDVTGDATLKGKLDVTGDISTNGSVTAKGGLSAANGNFTVDGTTGDTTLKGKLDVTGDTTLKGKLDVTGKATLKDELQVDKKATFGSAAGSQTVINGGDITADGQLNAKSARIGGVNGVGISDSGVITGVTKLTTKALEVTDDLVVSGDITGAALKGTSLAITGNGTITGDLGVTGAITGATINGATITTNSFNGATIGTTTFNGVTLTTDGDVSGRNMTASGTVTGTKITDGAGASMNAGTVKGTTITDGSGFTATGGNVSAKDVTATGTVKGTTVTDGVAKMSGGKVTAQNGVEVDANNYLNSSGLKTSNIDASKATIGKIKIEGSKITSTEADETVGIAGITVNNAGALNNVTSIDGVAVSGSAASGLTVGAGATAVTIGGNSLALSSTNFNVDDDGDVKGKSFTAGTSHLKDGELKLNDKNIWNTTEGIRAEKATIGANTLNGTGFSTTGTLDVAGKATFGSNAANSTTIEQGAVSVNQNGKTTTIKGGEIETDKLTVNDIVLKNSMKDGTGNTINIKGSDGSMSVASGAFAVDKDGQLTNKISGTAGGYSYETKLETSKSGIKANYTNAINGNQNIIDMGANGISIGVAGTTPSVGAGFKAELDAATMGYGTANSIVVNKETIKSALGTGVTRVMTNNTTEQSIVDKVGTAKRSLKADEIVDEVAGMTVKTNSDGTLFTNGTTNTLINGSAITSTKATGDTGVLNGSNLTLTNGANSTALAAGGATFTGAAGEKGGKVTTINGGTITTDTLNVERINLGGEVIDKGAAGVEANSKLYMDAQGNFRAAGGNFKVNGADGAMTNTVGNTTLKTDANGAGMSYDNTAATGGVKSNVSVGNNNANVSAGAGSIDVTNESITSKVGTDASSTITKDSIVDKVGGTTVETKDGSFSVEGNTGNGMKMNTTTGETTFTGAAGEKGGKTTTINGGNITTDTLNVERINLGGEMVDKTGATVGGNLSMDAQGNFSAAGGKFKVNGADGAMTNTVGKTSFATSDDGVNSSVAKDAEHKSEFKQGLTSIGGVVTNGTVKIAQTLDGDNGNITNEATDKDGKSSKLVQNGTGLEYTDNAKIKNEDGTEEVNKNATRINSSDVSIGSATDDSKRINLSDLGQIDALDSELKSHDKFTSNQTAVGGINAEAAIRREEVARLDNRIDDVNNRVDKVGAMAAAIASLKSIGYDPQAPSEFSIGLGQYKGETGVAMGFFHYPNKNFMINVSLSTAGGETMGGIGATWRFGHKSPQKLLDEQREAQAKKELAAAEKYQAAAKLAKEAQERAEYAAKLARQAQVSADNAKAAADATQAKHFQ